MGAWSLYCPQLRPQLFYDRLRLGLPLLVLYLHLYPDILLLLLKRLYDLLTFLRFPLPFVLCSYCLFLLERSHFSEFFRLLQQLALALLFYKL